ncbi:MAG TPA: tyrosine-type recombinase/integrase [Solirubrobacteraceae bacterium]|nr:tyrosine-type recombinase/integrase [Solirubrobacteraceae bacterium]
MARPARGTIESVPLSDGSLSIRGRFRHKGGRYRVAFGLDVDGWTEARGRRELDDILVQLRAGIPLTEILERYGQVDEDEPDVLTPGMSFHEYASDWLRRRRSGELGDPLSDNTNADYEWRLKKHILPFFARMPVAEIRDVDCQHFRAKLFAEREKLRELIAAGAKPKDRRGNPRKPLANRSIQMQMGLLAQILDDAVEDKLRKDNPARAKRLKVKVPKPNRTFLEIDQLVALLDAARELERDPRSTKRAKLTTAQVAEIRARLATGETQARLGREYRLAAGSMSMLAQGKTYRGENDRVGWRALCATLGYAGPRISEALDLRERNVRLHDPAGARFWIADSKTPTGVRHVEITPALRDELFTHLADKARRGYPIGPDEYLFCTRQGHRWSDDNVRARIIKAAAKRASAQLVARGLPPLPHVTPHTLRRTYVSIMLLATNFDVPFVQNQVGHSDSKMTMDVYAQLLDRSKRAHGVAFDALLSAAQETLYGSTVQEPPGDPRLHRLSAATSS